jgi:hypothetical protein
MIKDTDPKICMGHFEISGFPCIVVSRSHEGLDRGLFTKFEHTFSEVIIISPTLMIYSIRKPSELTWQDYNDDRGFHIFDLDRNELEFIKNSARCSLE